MDHREANRLLDDYVDGNLAQQVREQMERHLGECRECRHEVDQLRGLLARAADLPGGIEPARDLWPGIRAAALGPNAGRRRPGARRPVLAMAACLLAVLVIVVVSRHLGSNSGPGAGGGPHDLTRTSDWPTPLDRDEAATMATLQALQAECGWVDPEVEAALPHNERDSAFFPLRRLIQENRRIIDLAIAQIGEAWAANPESTQLAHLLASAYLARADLRRQEARLATMEQTFL